MRSVCIKFPSLGKRLLYCGSRKKELFTRERNKCTSTRVWGLIKSLTYVSLNKNWLTFPWTQDDNWPHIRRSEHVQDLQFKHLLKLAFLSWKQTNKKKQFWGILFSIRTIKILARLSFICFRFLALTYYLILVIFDSLNRPNIPNITIISTPKLTSIICTFWMHTISLKSMVRWEKTIP